MQFKHQAVGAIALASLLAAGGVLAKDIRIAHVYDKTGALEAYAKQTQTGLMMGLDYATNGTMMVNGNKLVVIEKDTQGKPDVAKAQLAAAYSDDRADIAVGPTSSGTALAMLPVAEEYKKILLVEPAVADSITGEKWNRYIFRTGRNSSQDAIANAVALDKPGVQIATLAQDYAFGRDGVKAFKGALKNAKIVLCGTKAAKAPTSPPVENERPAWLSTTARTSGSASMRSSAASSASSSSGTRLLCRSARLSRSTAVLPTRSTSTNALIAPPAHARSCRRPYRPPCPSTPAASTAHNACLGNY